MSDVTQLLSAIDRGDPTAADQLLPLVYKELRSLAARKLGREAPGHTLQPTALVHEAYLRLVGEDRERWDGRGHFFTAAAEAMRRILVENARRKGSLKRGGDLAREEFDPDQLAAAEFREDDLAREEFDPDQLAAAEFREDLLALDEALDRLAAADPEAARLVQLRYFAGLTLAEAAKVMGISPRTADRLWAYARAWLRDALQSGG
jgi:RNA polymerase sigma factor (sigma-70 family)